MIQRPNPQLDGPQQRGPQQGAGRPGVRRCLMGFPTAFTAIVAIAFVMFAAVHEMPRVYAAQSADAANNAGETEQTALTVTEGCAAEHDCSHWVGTWATALTVGNPADPAGTGRSFAGFQNESIRQIAQTSVGGAHVRIRVSNVYGQNDLVIGHATVARPAVPSTPELDPASIHEIFFRGQLSVTVPAGHDVLSDPVPMVVAPLTQLAVTIYLPQATGPTSWHWFAQQTAFVYDSDHALEPGGGGYKSTLEHFFFLTGIEVPRSFRADGTVAVLGDSIADGFGASTDTNTRWPDFLARRLVEESRPARNLGVLNVGLSGNAVNHDGDEVGLPEIGPRAIKRLDDHVFSHPGVRTVIVAEGLNDIFLHDDPPEKIIAGLRQLTYVLRARGLRVLLATLSPAAGATNWSPERETIRAAVNAYIRGTHDANGIVDVDAAVRDPANPTFLNPLFIGTKDLVHPNDEGNRAIAAAVPLSLL